MMMMIVMMITTIKMLIIVDDDNKIKNKIRDLITTNTTTIQIVFQDIYLYCINIEQYHCTITITTTTTTTTAATTTITFTTIIIYTSTTTTTTTTTTNTTITTTTTIPDNVDARACLFSVNPISDSILSHASLNRLPYIPLIFPKNWRCSRTVSIG